MTARIALADDNAAFLDATAQLLEREGYQVTTACNGREALEVIGRDKPDLVLLDIMMPGLDGISVMKQIRDQDPHIGVVMMTAFGSEEMAVEALTAGADDYLIKPLDYQEAFIRLDIVLGRSQLRRERKRLQVELSAAHDELQARYGELEASYQRIQELEEKTRELFERYLPSEVARYLIDDPSRANLGGERREVTVLFADLRGFTALAEKMAPETLIDVVNGYLTLATEAIFAQGGILDKFMGDAVMAVYNAPIPQPDHALRAVNTAFALRENLRGYDAEPSLHFGFGVNTGEAVVGNVGSEALMNYTAIGDAVNVAFRLQEQAKGQQILLSRTTFDQVRDFVEARPLGRMRIRRRAEEAEVYEALTLKGGQTEQSDSSTS
ncbi:MAG: response regulator [Anaerolineae bacterium]|nr:response regulator [Anaerolineae bacterium]NIN96898.1 response regulator [Anaerolineae bacterium]NIQ79867.1 response regulator [Anaerolineae bacterium]